MIWIARIFEAWRDARIFEYPIEPRGFLWHAFKFPQFGLLIGSGLFYFIGFYFWPGYESTLLLALGRTAFIILIDVLVAWAAFEFFLKRFRASMRLNVITHFLEAKNNDK